jgi:hypothetical protein
MRYLGRIVLIAVALAGVALFFLAHNDLLLTDAATRLAYDLERQAAAIRRSGESTLTFTHNPLNSPEGVTGAYTVTFKAGPTGTGFLGFSKGQQEVWYHTSYHLRFVVVPKDLKIRKAAGEPFRVVLRKSGDTVEVTGLR